MKGRTIILDHLEGREAAALMVDGQLDDFLLESDAPPPGTIYRARAERPVKGQGGMFLSTPDGPAFLKRVKGLAQGTSLLVQVTGYAEPGKAIPVSSKLLFKSRYAIVTPEAPGINVSRSIHDDEERIRIRAAVESDEAVSSGFGIILRSACQNAADDEVAEDAVSMVRVARQVLEDQGQEPEVLLGGDGPHVLAWRDWSAPADLVREPGGFENHGILDELDRIRAPHVPLPGGGALFVETTRALVAVDVNTGPDTSLAAGLKANLACARALPRALRLRGLGGQIVLDLAPMPKKDRPKFESAMRAALRADPEETALVGWTGLGHYELQRKRGRVPLREILP